MLNSIYNNQFGKNTLIIILFLISVFHKHLMIIEGLTTSDILICLLLVIGIYLIFKNDKFYYNKISISVLFFLLLNLFLYFFNKNYLGFNINEYFKSLIKLTFYSLFFLILYNILKLKLNKFYFSDFLYKLTFYYSAFAIIILILQYLKVYLNIQIPIEIIWFGLGEDPGMFGQINGKWSIGGFEIHKTRGIHLEPSFYGLTVNLFLFFQIKINNINLRDKKLLIIFIGLINTFSITTYVFTLFNILLIFRKNLNNVFFDFKKILIYCSVIILLLIPFINNTIINRIILISEFKDRSAIKRINFSIDSALYNLDKSNYLGTSVGNSNMFSKPDKFSNRKKYFIYRTAKSEYTVEHNISYGIIFLYILSVSGILGLLIFCTFFLWINDKWSKLFLLLICLSSGSFLDSLFWLSLTSLIYISDDQ